MSFLKNIKQDVEYAEYKLFYDLITKENKKFNITSIENEREFFIKNVQDCIYGCELYDSGSKILEIGSGGGFPSVPVKIKRKDLSFTLVESNEKKVNFLKKIKEIFNFEDFDCILGRAEELSKKEEMRERFDYGIARAVAPLNVLCELLLPFIRAGGKMVAYKGKNYKEELSAAENAIYALGGKASDIIEYELDEGFGKRALVIIEKVKKTDEKYPRRFAKIKKDPL